MNLKMLPPGSFSVGLWILPCAFGLCSVLLLLLCAKKKKERSSVTMVRYVQSEENDNVPARSRASTNATNSTERPNEQRLSLNSIPNENRILPAIPKAADQVNGAPPTPDPVMTGTTGDGNGQSVNSSPKKNRRLPALPPPGVETHTPRDSFEPDKDIDGTYEDLRDDCVSKPNPHKEAIGSGDSSLYAKVKDDPEKQDDSDLYAQVGEGDTAATAAKLLVEKKNSSSSGKAEAKANGRSSTSEEEKLLDSPTNVTYASVDKMKKTVSIKRNSGPPTPGPPPPPPIPDRNFDEDDGGPAQVVVVDTTTPPAPVLVTETPSTSSAPEASHATTQHTGSESSDQLGPAYDTLSVRESFAHQRLRQIVEDEQRNRYVNTNQAINNDSEDSGQPDVYAQIEDESPEAVYESVSAPGSADGTVGVTGRSVAVRNGVTGGGGPGYVTIGEVRSETATATAVQQTVTSPPNGGVLSTDPHYEDINPR